MARVMNERRATIARVSRAQKDEAARENRACGRIKHRFDGGFAPENLDRHFIKYLDPA
jgi:hypothetical protein